MTQKTRVHNLPEFDAADYLNNEQAVADYLTAIIDEGDASLLAAALGDVAKARGMSEIAKASGITREALYKALRPGASPRFETIAKVIHALGVKLTATPA